MIGLIALIGLVMFLSVLFSARHMALPMGRGAEGRRGGGAEGKMGRGEMVRHIPAGKLKHLLR